MNRAGGRVTLFELDDESDLLDRGINRSLYTRLARVRGRLRHFVFLYTNLNNFTSVNHTCLTNFSIWKTDVLPPMDLSSPKYYGSLTIFLYLHCFWDSDCLMYFCLALLVFEAYANYYTSHSLLT